MQKLEVMPRQFESDIAPKKGIVKLHLVVRDKNGKFVRQKFIDNDMYLDQWQAIIAALFKNLGNQTYSSSTTFSCKNSAGTSVTLGGVASTGNSPLFATALEGKNGQLKVAIGTGSTAAAHTDYWLQTPISQAFAYPSSVTVSNPSGGILYVTFSATISLSSATTVTEAVVQLVVLDSSGAYQGLAITHDIFSQSVPAGGSITLNYTFQFNTS
jgi:hypothetical protein